MSKNNLHTLSYFRKRLLEAGYTTKTLIPNFFSKNDPRKWMISIMGERNYPIFCVCELDVTEDLKNEYVFRFFDCSDHFTRNTVKTKSMNVIILFLSSYAI